MPRGTSYEGKQRRKAYALFHVRQNSSTAHKARAAYRLGLGLMSTLFLGLGWYMLQSGEISLIFLTLVVLLLLGIAWRASYIT